MEEETINALKADELSHQMERIANALEGIKEALNYMACNE